LSLRGADWLEQAKREARWSLKRKFYEWACFVAQQAVEKAVKAIYERLHCEAWGNSISYLLRDLPEEARPENNP